MGRGRDRGRSHRSSRGGSSVVRRRVGLDAGKSRRWGRRRDTVFG
jgi:hypothetical protein